MLPKNPSLFAFDKDGTIIDVHHYWVSMTQLRVKLISEHHTSLTEIQRNHLLRSLGVNLNNNQMFADGPTGVKPRVFNQQVAENFLKENDINDNFYVREAFLEADIISEKNIKNFVKPLPDAINLINSIYSLDINIAVISNDIHSRVKLAMESLGIMDKISLIIGGDEVKNVKPAGDMLLRAIDYFKCNPSDVVNIGDHPNDIRMGHNSDVKFNIGVLTGLNDADKFTSLKCKLVNNLSEVKMELE